MHADACAARYIKNDKKSMNCIHFCRVDNAFLVSLVGLRPEKHFWIGLSNQKNIDVFEWTNSPTVRFTHWNSQMPGMDASEFLYLNIRNKLQPNTLHMTIAFLNAPRLPAGLCCHDNWGFGWTLGPASLHQQRKIYLQVHGRGDGSNCSTTNCSSS